MSKTLTKKQQREAEIAEDIRILKQFGVKPGATVYTSVSHVARSGMSRRIHCYIVSRVSYSERDGTRVSRNEIQDITGYVAEILGYKRHRDGGFNVGGCGMDMGFHVVYCLGRAMFPKGGPLTKTGYVRRSQAEREGVNREVDGGYLLQQRWL